VASRADERPHTDVRAGERSMDAFSPQNVSGVSQYCAAS
jgi:hypothetical protein